MKQGKITPQNSEQKIVTGKYCWAAALIMNSDNKGPSAADGPAEPTFADVSFPRSRALIFVGRTLIASLYMMAKRTKKAQNIMSPSRDRST
jgi:hypothetical protein